MRISGMYMKRTCPANRWSAFVSDECQSFRPTVCAVLAKGVDRQTGSEVVVPVGVSDLVTLV
jgi:hypothetical protein